MQPHPVFTNDLEINKYKKLFLNQPNEPREELDYDRLKGEVKLEYEFVYGDKKVSLMKKSDAKFLERQLPVGLFHDKVAKGYEIFTTRKSAIDIWGISKQGDLLLFELKDAGNSSIGILTELLFYCFVMKKVMDGIFRHEDPVDKNIDEIRRTSKIKAYFLAPRLHPLLDEKLVQVLNKTTAPEVEFDYLWFDKNDCDKVEYGFKIKKTGY